MQHVSLMWSDELVFAIPFTVIMGIKNKNDHILPSHWPVFWFLLKPGLHWHTALVFVWLQIASSPHGFVFFPHTSPLETKDRTLITHQPSAS